MSEFDPALLGAVIGGAATIATSLVFVGRKVERVDQRLARIEEELAETKRANLRERVALVEREVESIKLQISELKA